MRRSGRIIILLTLLAIAIAAETAARPQLAAAAYTGGEGRAMGAASSYPVVLLVLFLIFAGIFLLRRSSLWRFTRVRSDYSESLPESCSAPDYSLVRLKQNDPGFSEDGFIARVNGIFLRFQDSWMKKNLDAVRPYETGEMYNTHARELQAFIDSRRTNMIRDLCIQDTQIAYFSEAGGDEFMEVTLRARLKNYVVDDDTHRVVEGDPDREIPIDYLLRMTRKRGVHTRRDAVAGGAVQCPNCGAGISAGAPGRCEYCGGAIAMEQCDWALSSVKVIDDEMTRILNHGYVQPNCTASSLFSE